MGKSRTLNAFRNANFALVFYFAGIALGFFSRKVFIDCLGAEILGLNTALVNLLGFVNLAESGLGAAVAFSLYEPLAHKDQVAVNEILSIQARFYRRISIIVLASGGLISLAFPYFFANEGIPLIFVYATFFVLLINTLLGYCFNYRQIVFNADQKEYKITLSMRTCFFVKTGMQIFAVSTLPKPYAWWILLEFFFGVFQTIILSRIIRKEYPWLKLVPVEGDKMKIRHSKIMKRTWQAFFHRIGGYVLFQASPLILFAFTSLTMVAIYGNYVLIATSLAGLMNAIFNSIVAGIGNLNAEKDMGHVLKVFWEYLSLRFYLAGIVIFSMLQLANPFIDLWIGEGYLLPELPFYLFCAYYFIKKVLKSATIHRVWL